MKVTLLIGLGVGLFAGICQAEGIRFKKHVLSEEFFSEGCTVADVNKDGRIDVIAGPFWYQAPNWERHEIREPGEFNWDGGYSQSFVNGAMDINGDGWEDIIIVGFPGEATYWYENPRNERGHWKRHEVFRSTCNESPLIVDLDGDGRLDMVFPFEPEKQMAWFKAPRAVQRSPAERAQPGAAESQELSWTKYPISKPDAPGTHRFAHGLGVGDINQDGRDDVVVTAGWWESPEDPRQPDWTFHAADLGPDCAQMYVYDFDGDGDMDIVSSSAHNYGLWWHEQGKDAEGKVTWTRHEIDTTLSQLHALVMTDLNGDGLPDLVTGKRFWAHNGHDPGAREPALLVWYEFSRKDGKPTWTRHEIDDDSGVGTQFVVQDITGDDKLDIIVSNKKGTFVFENMSE